MTPTRLCTLLFIQDDMGRLLLLERTRPPNLGLWSPPGGKVEMAEGESPFQCACREAQEEVGLSLTDKDLHLFSIVNEKAYEGQSHWLLFLFKCKKTVKTTPPPIGEGRFQFFSRQEINTLSIPESDKSILWPLFDQYQDGFISLRLACTPGSPLKIEIEEIH